MSFKPFDYGLAGSIRDLFEMTNRFEQIQEATKAATGADLVRELARDRALLMTLPELTMAKLQTTSATLALQNALEDASIRSIGRTVEALRDARNAIETSAPQLSQPGSAASFQAQSAGLSLVERSLVQTLTDQVRQHLVPALSLESRFPQIESTYAALSSLAEQARLFSLRDSIYQWQETLKSLGPTPEFFQTEAGRVAHAFEDLHRHQSLEGFQNLLDETESDFIEDKQEQVPSKEPAPSRPRRPLWKKGLFVIVQFLVAELLDVALDSKKEELLRQAQQFYSENIAVFSVDKSEKPSLFHPWLLTREIEVRSTPSEEGETEIVLTPGCRLITGEQEENWIQVFFQDSGAGSFETGWVPETELKEATAGDGARSEEQPGADKRGAVSSTAAASNPLSGTGDQVVGEIQQTLDSARLNDEEQDEPNPGNG